MSTAIVYLSDNIDLTQDELAVYSVLSKNTNKPISEIMSSPSIDFGKSKVTEILKRLARRDGDVELVRFVTER